MADSVHIAINGTSLNVSADSTVAAALVASGFPSFRKSVTGEPRGPLCGMGICFECRVTVDGEPHIRACQTLCRDGMDVRTDA
jgi:predicted molibdopterin-dependent oxidoreductase YjgC